jgi:formate hydrogenlyase transcriptional activator
VAEAAEPGENGETIEDVERQLIAAVLRQTQWHIEGAAGATRRLGLNPSTLRGRIKKLELRRGAE